MRTCDPALGRTLATALEKALAYLEHLDNHPVGATVDLETLRNRLRKPLSEEGIPPEQVVAELVEDVEGGIMGSAGPRFFAWVVGGSVPAALAADWLSATWDQNAGNYACGPAAAVVEEVAGGWLKEILGIPVEASFAFVSGCQMAHVTCLASARHALLAQRGWNVEEQGLHGAPPIRILSSQERHGSFERAIRLLGLGLSRLSCLPADRDGKLDPSALERALELGRSDPTIVLLQAGDINTGAYDPFEILIPIAKRYDAWVHIDGAFGLWAAASPRYKHLVRGVEQADSWATDGHKWLNVPYDCGYAFVADPAAHRGAMSYRAAYLTHDGNARDQMDWNPEWSRRARGFPTYAALRQLGRIGVASLVEHCCKCAYDLATRIGALTGAEMIREPLVNQGLVRFLDPRPDASETDHDRWTDKTIAAIGAEGEAFFSGTTWQGRRAMRLSVCNWQTGEEDIERTVRSIEKVLSAG
jgi:glutamate/tyrosine decarboxylase-like PLP-dependent enzyme